MAGKSDIPDGTTLTCILLSTDVEKVAAQLLADKKVAAVQKFGPEQVNKVRVAIVVMPNAIEARRAAIDALIAACAPSETNVLHDSYTTYGRPNFTAPLPPLFGG